MLERLLQLRPVGRLTGVDALDLCSCQVVNRIIVRTYDRNNCIDAILSAQQSLRNIFLVIEVTGSESDVGSVCAVFLITENAFISITGTALVHRELELTCFCLECFQRCLQRAFYGS